MSGLQIGTSFASVLKNLVSLKASPTGVRQVLAAEGIFVIAKASCRVSISAR